MYFEHEFGKLYYEEIGKGKPVLLIHGFGCDHNLMKKSLETVFKNHKKKSYKRIYIDLPGMGMSEIDPTLCTPDNIFEILSLFIKEKIKENFLMGGQSYGGYMARALLTRFQNNVDGLLLIVPAIVPESEDKTLPKENVRFIDKTFLSTLNKKEAERFCQFTVIADEKVYKRYKSNMEVGIKKIDKDAINKLEENFKLSKNIYDRVKKIVYKNPTAFICGKQDICVGYKNQLNLLEDYPRATFAILDVAGHNLHIEQVEMFEAIVENWLIRTQEYNVLNEYSQEELKRDVKKKKDSPRSSKKNIKKATKEQVQAKTKTSKNVSKKSNKKS